MALNIVMAVIAYLIGSINFSVIISKRVAGFDVREKGSGNAGTTNMLRSVGKGAAAVTLLCDVLKGIVAIVIAIALGNIFQSADKALLVQIAGIAVVLGHTFPIFFGFKGGKGVATSLGILLVSNWQIGLICLVFAAAVLYPVLTLFIDEHYIVSEGSGYLVYSIILAVIVLFNHRENIKRIMNGTENRVSFKK